ncbi:MAG: hypothetical protein GX424_02180 [Clostridiales bacterium]|nr:hypothetical protein [Clostridiales bacterium]
MSDGRMALNFFEIGLVLTFISMVLGPFGVTEWAIASALVACVLALAGICLAFSSWDEPDDESSQREQKTEAVQAPGGGAGAEDPAGK